MFSAQQLHYWFVVDYFQSIMWRKYFVEMQPCIPIAHSRDVKLCN